MIIFCILAIFPFANGNYLLGVIFLTVALFIWLNKKFIYSVIEFLSGIIFMLAPIMFINPYLYGDALYEGVGWQSKNPFLFLLMKFVIAEIVFIAIFLLARASKSKKA